MSKHKIIIIVAVDEENGIGKNNNLLYNIPSDMKFFKDTTMNNIIVYGRKTLESFPHQKPLPNRTNVVLSKGNINVDDLIVANSIDECLLFINNIDSEQDVFICGGSSIYKQFLEKDVCDEIYMTKIYSKNNADVYFPNFNFSQKWEIYDKSEIIKDEKSGINIQFFKFKKT